MEAESSSLDSQEAPQANFFFFKQGGVEREE